MQGCDRSAVVDIINDLKLAVESVPLCLVVILYNVCIIIDIGQLS